MFVLDTNVVSELMKGHPNPEVLAWLDNQLTDTLFLTAVTEAEIGTGIAILPEGERQRGLLVAAERTFGVFSPNVSCPSTARLLRACAAIAARRRAAGRPISQADCQIAANARSRGATVATRDTNGFEGCGLDVVNPWSND